MSITEEINAKMNAAVLKMQREADLLYLYGIEPEPQECSEKNYLTYADVAKRGS